MSALAVSLPEVTDIAPSGSGRLLSAFGNEGSRRDLATHRRTYPSPDRMTARPTDLLDEIERSGLRGRGGAAFPTATKLRAVAGRPAPVVVVNATEGEPASRKDALLMAAAPHLVLDGALLAALAVGATTVRICVSRDQPHQAGAMRAAIAERAGHERLPAVAVSMTPMHFVVGEETALTHWLDGADAMPTGNRPSIRGVGGRPTVVCNAETFAHVTQIIRFGATWFRQVGSAREPGTMLCTVTRADATARVVEVVSGTLLPAAIQAAGATLDGADAVLVGGYFGSWITAKEAARVGISNADLQPLGASAGCGVIIPIPRTVCGWCETTRVLQWMAGESTGQCGSCFNGLSAIARTATEISTGAACTDARAWLTRWASQVDGRGGCRMPDGAVRLLRSALRVHDITIDEHLARGGCPKAAAPFLAIPDHHGEPWR